MTTPPVGFGDGVIHPQIGEEFSRRVGIECASDCGDGGQRVVVGIAVGGAGRGDQRPIERDLFDARPAPIERIGAVAGGVGIAARSHAQQVINGDRAARIGLV